jgi:hypothetical protein
MDKYVKSIKKDLKESVSFFGNKNKQDREIWVLKEFLKYLPIEAQDSDFKGSDVEPNDAFYKHTGFQIKELQTEERKRGKEYKDKLNAINDETKPKDLLENYSHIHIPLSTALPRVSDELKHHRIEKYKNNTTDMNVLVYLNLSDTTYTSEIVNTSLIDSELRNWKSVSLVTNNCAIVLSCYDDSNDLLKPLAGKLFF